MNNQKISKYLRSLNSNLLSYILFVTVLLSGNLMSQVTDLPVFKSNNETTANIDDLNSNNIFEYTSSHNQTLKSVSIQNVENTSSTIKYHYSVSERKQDNNKIQSTSDFANIASIFCNNNESKSTSNYNQTFFVSKTNFSVSNSDQQIPFQELNKVDNQQTMQKSGPAGNPGDPGIIPVGDGIVLLMLALGFYTIFKFKNL